MSTRNNYPIGIVYERIADYNLSTATTPGGRRNELRVLCPVHLENNPSCDLDLDKNIWICRSCHAGGDAVDMVIKSKTIDGAGKQAYARAFAWLDETMGTPHITPTRALPKPKFVTGDDGSLIQITKRTIFPYLDVDARESFQTLRLDGINTESKPDKTFRKRRRLPVGAWRHLDTDRYEYINLKGEPIIYGPTDPSPIIEKFDREPRSQFLYKTRGLHGIIFNLPEVLKCAAEHGTLTYAEGEKKIRNLAKRARLTGTKAPGGAKAPIDPINLGYVAGVKRMIIFSDSDDVGREGAALCRDFFKEAIDDIIIVDLYGDRSKRDIDDWLAERPDLSVDATRDQLGVAVRKLGYR